MMRLLLALAAYAALTVSGFAQAPNEITATQTIILRVGQNRVFTFPQPVTEIKSSDDLVQVTPYTDVEFVFSPKKAGNMLMTAIGPDGRVVHRFNVDVLSGFVRIYGTGTADEKKSDYVGYVCSESGCGRADPELDRVEGQSSVTRTRRNSRGDIITTTRGN